MSRFSGLQDIDHALMCGKAEIQTAIFASLPPSASSTTLSDVARPLDGLDTNLEPITNAEYSILSLVEFQAYDHTVISPDNDPALVKMYETLDTEVDLYVQAKFRGGLMFDFQPNHFIPEFWINGVNFFGSLSRNNFGFGVPIPWKKEPLTRVGKVETLRAAGTCAQKVTLDDASVRYVEYGVYCHAEFICFYE